MSRAGRAVGSLGVLLAAAWLAGFVWYVRDVAELGAGRTGRAGAQAAGRADGIVVLTGGADRIATGLRLLRDGRARVMLISGVGHGAELRALLRGTGIDPAPLAERITLGRAATSTAGNADETASWVAAQDLHSLLVVTASYHMQRALTELQRSLPAIRLAPVPVLPPALRGWEALTPATLRLLAGEYTKYLVVSVDLARLGSDPGDTGGGLP